MINKTLDIFNKCLGGFNGYVPSLKGIKLEVGVVMSAGAAFILFGYDQGVMSMLVTSPYFLSYFPEMDPENPVNPNSSLSSMVVAIYEIGCLIGSVLTIFIGDKLGRRRTIILGTFIMVIGAIIQTASYKLQDLIVGRIITGIGNGCNTSSVPLLQSEMAHAKRRGFLVLFEGALIAGGISISYWVNFGMWYFNMTAEHIPHASVQFRFPFALQIIFAIFMFIGVFILPESPRWLAKHGYDDEAWNVLCRLRDGSQQKYITNEFNDIKEIVNKQTADGPFKLKELFKNGKDMTCWRANVAFWSQAMQQIGGINLVTYYATTLFEDSIGMNPTVARGLTAANGTEYFMASVIALFIVDRFGRRFLMMFGSAGMIVCLVFLAAFTSTGRKDLAIGACVMLFAYNSFFAIGWLGTTWLYPAEVTSLRCRVEVAALSTCANWLFNYLIVQIAPICLSTIEWKTYIIFIATNTSFIPLIYFLFPETKGHSLEELDRIFNKAHFEKRNPVYVEKEWRKLYGINTFLEDEEKPKVQHIEDRRFNDTDSNSS